MECSTVVLLDSEIQEPILYAGQISYAKACSRGSSSEVMPFSEEVAPLLLVASVRRTIDHGSAARRCGPDSFATFCELQSLGDLRHLCQNDPTRILSISLRALPSLHDIAQKIRHSVFASKGASFWGTPHIKTPRNHRPI